MLVPPPVNSQPKITQRPDGVPETPAQPNNALEIVRWPVGLASFVGPARSKESGRNEVSHPGALIGRGVVAELGLAKCKAMVNCGLIIGERSRFQK
jgi:hypothetical protein